MGKATNPRTRSTRSKGGRPRKDGSRYPSGKLKPVGPNHLVLERRKALCDDPTKATCPLDAAYANGWLDLADYRTGIMFAHLHRSAGFGAVGAAMGSSLEAPTPLELSQDVTASARSYFSSLSHAEIASIWDSVFGAAGEPAEDKDERAARANARWKLANAAMSPDERAEVHNVCILDSWPQWILQRRAGRMETSWERKRDLLISGLRAVRRALRPDAANEGSQVAPKPSSAPRIIERTAYVDEVGETVLEVVRARPSSEQ